jgi:hypothetical protein
MKARARSRRGSISSVRRRGNVIVIGLGLFTDIFSDTFRFTVGAGTFDDTFKDTF